MPPQALSVRWLQRPHDDGIGHVLGGLSRTDGSREGLACELGSDGEHGGRRMKHSIRMERCERRWLSNEFDLGRLQRRANAKNQSVPRRSQDPIDHRPHPYTDSPSNDGKQRDPRADDDLLRGRR